MQNQKFSSACGHICSPFRLHVLLPLHPIIELTSGNRSEAYFFRSFASEIGLEERGDSVLGRCNPYRYKEMPAPLFIIFYSQDKVSKDISK